jgi:hypothetical protein
MMSNERDELANVIVQHPWLRGHTVEWPKGYCPTCRKPIEAGHNSPAHAEHIADAILAIGYRKPAVVTTAEELDALPVGSVVLTAHGKVARLAGCDDKACGDKFLIYANLGDNIAALNALVVAAILPATVLHVGGEA